MRVKQSHLIIFIIACVIVVGYFIQDKGNKDVVARSDKADVALCEASLARAAYTANGFRRLADRVERRHEAGDLRAAKEYRAVADSIIATFPPPANSDGRVDRVEDDHGVVTFSINPNSAKLQAEACRHVLRVAL